MPRLPILGPNIPGSEDPSQPQGSHTIIDGHLDQFGSLHKRHGLRPVMQLPTDRDITGMYYWEQTKKLVVTAGNQAWAMTEPGPEYYEITPLTYEKTVLDVLEHDKPVTFASDGTYLYFCNGKELCIWNGGLTYRAGVDRRDVRPINPEFILYLKRYMIAPSKDSREFLHALRAIDEAPEVLPTWSPISHQSSSSPSNIRAAGRSREELIFLTYDTGQFHYLNPNAVDETNLFPPLEGSYLDVGILAPHSLQFLGGTWVWLDNNRRIVQLQDRSPVPISASIDRILRNLRTIEDAFAFTLPYFYVITFPSEDLTYAYDVRTGQWLRWGFWLPQEERYRQFLGRHSAIIPGVRTPFVGGKYGMVYAWDSQWLKDGENPIRLFLESAHLDHGTPQRKEGKRLTIRLKRGF